MRGDDPYLSVQRLVERTSIRRNDLDALAAAGALTSIAGHRHKARWMVTGVEDAMPLFPTMEQFEAIPMLKRPTEGQDIVSDYQSLGLSLGRHPGSATAAEAGQIRLCASRYVFVRCPTVVGSVWRVSWLQSSDRERQAGLFL